MLKSTPLVFLLTCTLALTLGAASPPPAKSITNVKAEGLRAEDAVALATAICGAFVTDTGEHARMVHSEGCYLWQQPGAGFTVTGKWMPGDVETQLWHDQMRFLNLLREMDDLSRDEPVMYPPESWMEGGAPDPQVYLLDSEMAAERIALRNEHHLSWVEIGGGTAYSDVPESHFAPDYAVVFITSDGPIEMYFMADEGSLKLIHMIVFDYFSA